MSDADRLLEILSGRFTGGVERYGLTIALAATERWDVHAAFPHTDENAELTAAFQRDGVGTHPLDRPSRMPPVLEVLATAARTLSVLRRVRPDVVHVNVPLPTFALGYLIACAFWRVPTVVVFHSTPPDRFDQGRSKRLYPVLHRRAHAWVAVSRHVRDSVARAFLVPPEQVLVIPNGVPPAPAEPMSDAERAAVRRELGIPEDSFLVLSVGRLSPEKGHLDIMPAAIETARHAPHVHFVVVGEGPERSALEERIRDQRLEATVHLAGHRGDVDRLLASADLFLFPSYWEGSPFALLEAASHALPIISADFTGAREVVASSESGLLYRPGDTEGLRAHVTYAIDNTAAVAAMGERARLTASHFSRESMVTATLAVLEGAWPGVSIGSSQ